MLAATRSIDPFLPPHLLQHLVRRGAPTVPHLEQFPAALLLADICGFTALTERLQARRREGAEEIAVIVNRVFRPAIAVIARRGGSIVSFGGDALYAVFPGLAGVRRGLLAAREIEAAFAGREVPTSRGTVRLTLTQALHWGRVHELHLGTDDSRVLAHAGPAVRRLVRMEAAGGRLTVSGEARAAQSAARPREIPRRAAGAPSSPPSLASYVPPPVRALVGGYAGEYRHATVLFLDVRSSSCETLQRFVTRPCSSWES